MTLTFPFWGGFGPQAPLEPWQGSRAKLFNNGILLATWAAKVWEEEDHQTLNSVFLAAE